MVGLVQQPAAHGVEHDRASHQRAHAAWERVEVEAVGGRVAEGEVEVASGSRAERGGAEREGHTRRVAHMDRNVALAAAVAIGGVVAMQAPLNSALGRPWAARRPRWWRSPSPASRSPALSALTGGLLRVARLGDAPLHVAIGGGLIGALYVGSIVFTVRELGAGGLTAATISGQLAVATAIDHFGWLGVAKSPVTMAKVAGIAFLALGTCLVVRD